MNSSLGVERRLLSWSGGEKVVFMVVLSGPYSKLPPPRKYSRSDFGNFETFVRVKLINIIKSI